jgi:hemolysin III
MQPRFSPQCRPFTQPYDRAELLADALVHATGVIFAVSGMIFLLAATREGTQANAVVIYTIGLCAMFGISALYNLCPVCRFKLTLRRFDHAVIYLFIAATYTPFLAIADQKMLLGAVWVLAAAGVLLKLLFPNRFDRISVALYLCLGWSGVFAYNSVFGSLSVTALWLLVIGGVFYSAGTIFHLWDRLRFQNALWHTCVLAAAGIQYAAVFVSVAAPAG